MTQNTLQSAKSQKQDEFYTQLVDIEKELKHYKEQFKGKVIFLNCDDPLESNFWKYFALNFTHLGIKKLIATHFEREKPSYKLELTDDGFPVHTPLRQNGDFRSPECVALLQEADIVVTNPPFSLFREYVAQLVAYNKKFLIIGNMNAITYKEVFKLIKENKLWLGIGNPKKFRVPDDYEKGVRDEHGVKWQTLGNVCWFTNLDVFVRHEDLILYKQYTPEAYPCYDNYDAINVDKTTDIPVDYTGVMGVPISFLDKYNPDQFEILGITDRQNTSGLRTKKYTMEDSEKFNDLNRASVLKTELGYKAVYARILIRNKKVINI